MTLSLPDHEATDEYTYRLPSPDRILVPPPRLNDRGLPDLVIGPHAPADDLDLSFLRDVDYADFISSNSTIDWQYERRREAQQILPYLYLGPLQAAKDIAYLRKEGITMLIGVRHTKTPQARFLSGALKAADELGLARAMVDVENNQELIAAFRSAVRTINQHLRDVQQKSHKVGKVLVFCESGIERSAGIVAAYIMEMFPDCDDIKTMQIVHAQRFCVTFDDAMKRILQSYHDILRARRAVTTAGSGCVNRVKSPAHTDLAVQKSLKRTLDDAYDSDIDMELGEGNADVERFSNRSFTPFRDVGA